MCTASELGGGKFSNGVVTATFVHMFNSESLGKSLSELWDKKGRIWNDIGQGFEGGLKGYRDVMDNAPSGIKFGLQVVMTATETGLTWGFVGGFKEVYDFSSGMFFDTSPLASKSSMSGFYIKQYIDSYFGNENYELKNLIPVNY